MIGGRGADRRLAETQRATSGLRFAAMSSPVITPGRCISSGNCCTTTRGPSASSPTSFPGEPPRYIRAELYRYHFTAAGQKGRRWWTRERVGAWLPPLSVDHPEFRKLLEAEGWLGSNDVTH